MLNVNEFIKRKAAGEKLSMITCYDYSSAKIANKSSVDCLLVGDSAAMVIFGHLDTLPIETSTLGLLVSAVRRGAPNKFIIGDMPFLSVRKDLTTNIENIEIMMKAGANAIKLEGAAGNLKLVKHTVESGVPVMGHLGLTPQSIHQLGGFKVQGRKTEQARRLLEHAKSLEDAGCFSLVLECVPSPLAAQISKELTIPTIGIGAGPDTDGQVLVMQDLLGLNGDFKAKFLRQYLNGEELILNAFNNFHRDVQSKEYPSINESYE